VRRFRVSLMSTTEDTFGRVVSLAVHDLRTPLATVLGFARTLQRTSLGSPQDQYVGMMVAASEQLGEILDDLGVLARIESGRWEPNVQEVDSLGLARAAAESLDGATVTGEGSTVRADVESAERALYTHARCALRHGGVEALAIEAEGPTVAMHPITAAAAPVLMRETLRDFGSAVAARIVGALGGSIELSGERLIVRLPPA
jgi:signal transduction histidine kinase